MRKTQSAYRENHCDGPLHAAAVMGVTGALNA